MRNVVYVGIGCVVLVLVLVILYLELVTGVDDTRVERVDMLCNVSRVEYLGVELVNENMTIGQVRDLYCGNTYLTHKKILVDGVLGYVCDGNRHGFVGWLR